MGALVIKTLRRSVDLEFLSLIFNENNCLEEADNTCIENNVCSRYNNNEFGCLTHKAGDFTGILKTDKDILLDAANDLAVTESVTDQVLTSTDPAGETVQIKLTAGGSLIIGDDLTGSITQNIIADRFTQLVSLNLNRSVTRSRSGGIRPYFHPDDQDANCELPNVRNTCTSYSVEYNDFRRIGTSEIGRAHV